VKQQIVETIEVLLDKKTMPRPGLGDSETRLTFRFHVRMRHVQRLPYRTERKKEKKKKRWG